MNTAIKTFLLLLFIGIITVMVNFMQISKVSRPTSNILKSFLEYRVQAKNENGEDIAKLKAFISKSNEEQNIFNENKFRSTNLVILVQVHDRLGYLKHLIESLSESVGINGALLIFSHDIHNDFINNEIQKIKFCKVMQIFYPYSMQLYPNRFPGPNAKDYESKRKANLVQVKHHWWWKINFLFNNIRILENYTGSVVFLEEDHYVAPDFIHFLDLMKAHAAKTCADKCILFSLGLQHKDADFKKFNKILVTTTVENLGLTLDRTTWNLFANKSDIFCKYDDYNWDWSLVYIVKNFIQPKIYTMSPMAARVYHIGSCGVHTKGLNCDASDEISKYQEKQYLGILYPHHLEKAAVKRNMIMLKNGGWNDARDHELCLNMSKNNINK